MGKHRSKATITIHKQQTSKTGSYHRFGLRSFTIYMGDLFEANLFKLHSPSADSSIAITVEAACISSVQIQAMHSTGLDFRNTVFHDFQQGSHALQLNFLHSSDNIDQLFVEVRPTKILTLRDNTPKTLCSVIAQKSGFSSVEQKSTH